MNDKIHDFIKDNNYFKFDDICRALIEEPITFSKQQYIYQKLLNLGFKRDYIRNDDDKKLNTIFWRYDDEK